MALIGFEGFDDWQTVTLGSLSSERAFKPGITTPSSGNRWQPNGGVLTASSGLLSSADGFGPGQCFLCGGAGQLNLVLTGDNYPRLIGGFRFYQDNISANLSIFRFQDVSGGTVQCEIHVSSAGFIEFYRGVAATLLAASTVTTMQSSKNYWIDFDVTLNNATGAFTVKVNGVTQVSATGQNTVTSANNYADSIQFNGTANNSYFDDFYMNDATGSAPYNGLLTTDSAGVKVETLFATTNNSVAFTPLAATNSSMVKEVSFDADTTYNEATTAVTDTFNHGSLSTPSLQIFAVDTNSMMRATAGTVQARTKLISGAVTSNGTTQTLTTNYLGLRSDYQTDPNTGTSWAQTGVNATLQGYEATSLVGGNARASQSTVYVLRTVAQSSASSVFMVPAQTAILRRSIRSVAY